MKGSTLNKIFDYLKANEKKEKRDYYVPSLWTGNEGSSQAVKVNPMTYFKDVIGDILKDAKPDIDYNQSISKIYGSKHGSGGDWTYEASFYNIFPRQTAAYDHDNDGHIGNNPKDITLSKNGFTETGTFLKCIALLPYMKSLNINTVYMLPITSIGKDGNRGDLGSPYAIRNPYDLDENLADSLVPFTVDEQYKAFVEAAHIMGMRVINEFVLRTQSLGGDWIKEHPEWFYWIDRDRVDEYHSPEFPANELAEIKKIPKGGGFHFAPNKEYRSLFKLPPKPSQIKIEDGKYVAYTKEGALVIPGAFADWPPDDIQPAWSDVTYFRMYDFPFGHGHNDYNYIAYDTIRYYNPELATEANANRPLWDKLAGVIPHYQKDFGIDGVMMDMGHAVPKPLMEEIISDARIIDEDFAFCEENFDITYQSREAGYNAVLGHEWRVTAREKRKGIQRIVQDADEWLALPFYGTPETHNTPRATMRGGENHSKVTWVINSFLPNCIPFIHQGFELLEDWPVNTGLNFMQEESDYFSKERLPLFFKSGLNWDRQHHLIDYIKYVNGIRGHFGWFFKNPFAGNENSIAVHYPETGFESVIAFERFDPWQPRHSVLVIANTDYTHHQNFYLKIDGTGSERFWDHMNQHHVSFVDNWMSATLNPGQTMIIELYK